MGSKLLFAARCTKVSHADKGAVRCGFTNGHFLRLGDIAIGCILQYWSGYDEVIVSGLYVSSENLLGIVAISPNRYLLDGARGA